jgi:hypothetical protein
MVRAFREGIERILASVMQGRQGRHKKKIESHGDSTEYEKGIEGMGILQ